MTTRAVLEDPDPRLRQRAREVERFDADLVRLADDLADTLRANGGIGLAAPQLGEARRVLVADLSGVGDEICVYVNPTLIATAKIGFVEESCLSVPGFVANVMRATEVRVQAHDLDGKPFTRDLSAMHAVCLQHEIDHLDGRLFVDRVMFVSKMRYRWWQRSRRHRGRSSVAPVDPVTSPAGEPAARGA